MMPSQLSTQQKLHTPLPQLTEVSFKSSPVFLSAIKAGSVLIGCASRQTDLSLFHEAHFGDAAVSAFANEFMALKQANVHSSAVELDNDEHYYYDEEEDDGLGYYPDGVKRTLTDEQIAMFRHSELQALERARERNPRRRNSSSPVPVPVEQGDSEDGEIIGQEFPHSFAGKKKKNKKKKRGSGNGNKRGEPVVDLRRRTWDIVEQGVDSLDYDEMEQANASTERVAQRRRITYDDSG